MTRLAALEMTLQDPAIFPQVFTQTKSATVQPLIPMDAFEVLQEPQLGVPISIGKIYKRQQLQQRCQRNVLRLAALEITLQDHRIFWPVRDAFEVLQKPQLGVALSVGKVYTRQQLQQRCRRNGVRLPALEITLQDPRIFRPVFSGIASDKVKKDEEHSDTIRQALDWFEVLQYPGLDLNVAIGKLYTRQ